MFKIVFVCFWRYDQRKKVSRFSESEKYSVTWLKKRSSLRSDSVENENGAFG
jgi:hypothetical protein